MEALSPELILIILSITQIVKKCKWIPKKYYELLAIVIGAIADILIVLPTDLITTLETLLGGATVGLIATGMYKVADQFIINKK